LGYALALALSLVATPADAAKVAVCHVPPGNRFALQTITVDEKAVSAHLGHGDFLDSCPTPCDDLTACDDSDLCTSDSCSSSGYCLHTPVNCDDGNVCTSDSCDSGAGCLNDPVPGGACSDGDDCTGPDACSPLGTCQGQPIAGCCATDADCIDYIDGDTENRCSDDSCVNRSCAHSPVPCTDPDACTISSCNPIDGECLTSPRSCDDGNSSTGDTCDPATGCQHSGVPGVDSLCVDGEFVPKGVINVGLSINPNEGSLSTIVNGFTALGFPPIVYSNAEIASGKPITDGVTVLVIARVATLTNVNADYLEGVRSYIRNGGSIIGEYDGAALFFDHHFGSHSVIPLLNPSLGLFEGDVTGGGALLPLVYSTLYVSDPTDPLMTGLPASFLLGARAAFAVAGFNDNWLHTAAVFNSSGASGTIPAGTWPAVVSGRCGKGRIALFTMNHLQVISLTPANRMFSNTLNWLVGN
jgi:hypothetical protein